MSINFKKLIKFICVTIVYYYIIAKLTLPLIDNYIILRCIIFAMASVLLGKVYKDKWIIS